MATPSRSSVSSPENNLIVILVVALLSIMAMRCTSLDATSSIRALSLAGHFIFDDVAHAARDFGNLYHLMPSAALYPKSVSDIAKVVKHIAEMGPYSKLTVAARGHGHSLQAQAQAPGGIVVMMESLKEPETIVQPGQLPYIEVSGGALWIDVLQESLKYGLAPKSWTDYLYLTVGGTLSNAGVSGQTFHHGPQISNVYQLEIVTGNGEVMNCSSEQNADLFYGALGGLGQFGIITRARIALEPAPKKVRWIRVLYSDFSMFAEDQEMLVTADNTFDYIEGFVIKNRTGLLNTWRSFLLPRDAAQADLFEADGRTLYCLEVTKNFDPSERESMTQEVDLLLSKLRYIKSTFFHSEVSYLEFLNRVRSSEIKLKSKGLWDVPHPWLNLLVPKTRIQDFGEEVFGNIVKDSNSGPIIIYPVNGSRWDSRMSAVFLEEEIFYLVAFLFSVPSTSDYVNLEQLLNQNENILEFCKKASIPVKQYLPHYSTLEEWKAHYGKRWETFVQRKFTYDPLAILAPGQRIFQRKLVTSQESILQYL